jgi:hypothetical protein
LIYYFPRHRFILPTHYHWGEGLDPSAVPWRSTTEQRQAEPPALHDKESETPHLPLSPKKEEEKKREKKRKERVINAQQFQLMKFCPMRPPMTS